MRAAEQFQFAIVESLRAKTSPVDPEPPPRPYSFESRLMVYSAVPRIYFQRDFGVICNLKAVANGVQQAAELVNAEQRRCAAAKINRVNCFWGRDFVPIRNLVR